MNCNKCKYGGYDPCSDICDNCMHDPETGWIGFTDHRVGKYFKDENEQSDYYGSYFDKEYEDNEDIII